MPTRLRGRAVNFKRPIACGRPEPRRVVGLPCMPFIGTGWPTMIKTSSYRWFGPLRVKKRLPMRLGSCGGRRRAKHQEFPGAMSARKCRS